MGDGGVSRRERRLRRGATPRGGRAPMEGDARVASRRARESKRWVERNDDALASPGQPSASAVISTTSLSFS
eukprot:30877-Pelagococcus_subviridis.AAC.1